MTQVRVPDELVERYTARGWWGSRLVGDLVREYAASRPAAPAVVTPDRTSTWADYDRLADVLATALAVDADVPPGARVAIHLPDGLAVHAAIVAAQRAGVVAVGIGARAGDAEIAHLVSRTGADVLVTSAEHRGRTARELAADLARRGASVTTIVEVSPDDSVRVLRGADAQAVRVPRPDALAGRALGPNDLSMLNSTSGTTGLPKCVMQFENRWFHFSDLAAQAGPLGPADVFLGAVPAPFGFGLWTSHYAPVALGVPVVVLPKFGAAEMIAMIERERVTTLCCVSTQFRMLLNSPAAREHDLSSLRVMFTGGEAIPYEQALEFEQRTGAVVLQFFGSNETGAFSCTTYLDPPEIRLRTAGRLLEHMNVRLFDDDGADVTATGGPGQPGGAGPLTCLGYYDDPAANAQLFTADGAMLMGDLVVIRDGCIEVVGRTSDIVIRGGKNISAAAVEAEVGTHPSVDLVVVVPVPDPLFGERVAALVTLRDGHTALTLAELGRHLDDRGVTREWHPEHLLVVPELPRSSGAKLAKGEARRMIAEHLATRDDEQEAAAMDGSGWNFADLFEAVAARLPDATAVVDGARELTWREFDERSAALATRLRRDGVSEQGRVAVYLRNCAEFLESYYGCLLARVIPVNVNYRYGADELVYLFDDCDAEAVVVHADFADRITEIVPRLPGLKRCYVVGGVPASLDGLVADGVVVDYDEALRSELGHRPEVGPRSGADMLFVYTGGTTGMPKGVMWRQNDLFDALVPTSRDRFGIPSSSSVAELVAALPLPGPRGLSASPLMHGTGLFHQFVMLLSGGTAVIYDNRRFDPRALLRTVVDKNVTAMVIVGDAFGAPLVELLDAEADQYDLSRLEVISSSGAVWSRATKLGLLRHLPHLTLWDALAAGEGFGVGRSIMTADDLAVESTETAQFELGDHIRVRTAEGTLLPPGVPGEGMVVVTGALPVGYFKDEAKTAATFREEDGLRFSIPGDFVEVLPNGRAQFLGRGSGCINTGGEKVFVEEVEQVLHDHPDVADVAVLGVPDDRFGAIVCAVVRPRAGAAPDLADLSAFVKGRLAGYKAPRRLVLVEDVPRTPQGKPDYPALREIALARLAAV